MEMGFINKNVLLVSYFKSCNIGDILISETVYKMFGDRCNIFACNVDGEKVTESILSSPPTGRSVKSIFLKNRIFRETAALVGILKDNTYKKISASAKNCDAVVFAGGNMVMELGFLPSTTYKLYKTVKTLKKEGKKVVFAFCGVGPFRNKTGKRYMKKIFKYADFVSVRDEYSKSQINFVLPGKNVEIWPDPVLSLIPECNKKNIPFAIGVNVYFGCDGRTKNLMRSNYVKMISQMRNKKPNAKIVLFSSELTDINDISSVKESFKDDDNICVEKIKSAADLFALYGEISVVFASRMHTAITSMISSVPVVTLSWQPKVASLMHTMGCEKYNISKNDFISGKSNPVKLLLDSFEDTQNQHNVAQKISSVRSETFFHINKLLEEI